MLRYYVLATAIVVVFGGIVFAHRLAPPDLRISAQPSGTPTVETRSTPEPDVAGAFTGTGPWVLSALPDCFDEQSRVTGPYGELQAKIPAPAERIAPGTTVHVRACTLIVRAHDIWVERGADRLRVPPDAALYRVDGRLTLVDHTGTQLEVRRY